MYLTNREEVNNLLLEMISDLSEEALEELYSGAENDLTLLFSTLQEECYKVLFGEIKPLETKELFYLEKLTESVEETLRCHNVNYFATSVLQNLQILPHHLEWGDAIMNHFRYATIAARNHGKSVWFSGVYPAWKLYRYRDGPGTLLDRKLSRLGYLFSNTSTLSKEHLENLKLLIETNDILYEKLVPKNNKEGSWTKTQITCKNGAKLRVRGFGNVVRGGHPGWIVVDDPLKDNVMYSSEQRGKSIEYFNSVLLPMLEPGGQILLVGTPFHKQDLYGNLKEVGTWHIREYPAIFPSGKLLWESRFNKKSLKELRKTLGPLTFSREFLCRPISSGATIFPYDMMEKCIMRGSQTVLVNRREDFAIYIDRVVVGCDFAMSSSTGADSSVFTVWGINDTLHTMYLMHVVELRGCSYGEQMAHLHKINRNFTPDIFFMENNQFQMIFPMESNRQGLPVVSHHTGINKYDIKSGLPGLAVRYENQKIQFPYGNDESKEKVDKLISQHMSIAYTDSGLKSTDAHDDYVFSTWLGNLAATYQGGGFMVDFL